MGIKDVAARAGVSISTVSYVMSGKRTISKETRDKVMQAAADLGYRPKSQKTRGADDRRLNDTVVGDRATGTTADVSRTGWRTRPRTKVLAVSSPVHSYTDYSNYAQFFFGLATSARQHGYDLMLLMHESGGAEMRRVVSNHMADGILLLDVLMDDLRAEVAKSIDLPVVSVGYPENCGSVYCVDLDFARMAREVVERAYENLVIAICCLWAPTHLRTVPARTSSSDSAMHCWSVRRCWECRSCPNAPPSAIFMRRDVYLMTPSRRIPRFHSLLVRPVRRRLVICRQCFVTWARAFQLIFRCLLPERAVA